jgi:hypothetical protein
VKVLIVAELHGLYLSVVIKMNTIQKVLFFVSVGCIFIILANWKYFVQAKEKYLTRSMLQKYFSNPDHRYKSLQGTDCLRVLDRKGQFRLAQEFA